MQFILEVDIHPKDEIIIDLGYDIIDYEKITVKVNEVSHSASIENNEVSIVFKSALIDDGITLQIDIMSSIIQYYFNLQYVVS